MHRTEVVAHRRARHLLTTAVVAVGLVGAAACSSSSTSSSTTSAAPGSTAGATGTTAKASPGTTPGSTPGTATKVSGPCVKDPAAVIAAGSTPPATGPLPADLTAKLDAAAQSSFKEAASPGAIVGVRSPQGTWTAAYGDADPANKTPMAVGMHTRIGSVTKTFTGTALLQLQQQGKLSLDDTIDKYVSGVPNGDRITLRMLADMTSGVASYTADKAFTDAYFADPQKTYTPDQLIAVGVAGSPIFEPGAKFNYSNTNTVLLGKVIEKVTGKPVGEVMQSGVMEPLGMKSTVWPGDSADLPQPYAQGFSLQGNTARPDAPANVTSWNPSWTWTAGEVISTMDDLLVYGRALGTGQGVLDAKTQTERLTSIPGPAGYGIAAGCIDGWFGHSGEMPGYNTSVFYDTTSDTVVIVQTNSDIASGDCPQSPTLTDDPRDAVCASPATRMFVALSTVLGHTFTPNPQQ